MKFIKLVVLWWLKIEKATLGTLIEEIKPGVLFVPIDNFRLWEEEPFLIKLKSILMRRWSPNSKRILEITINNMTHEIFGGEEDFGSILLAMTTIHQKRLNNSYNDLLSEVDVEKTNALISLGILTRNRFSDFNSDYKLNLRLNDRVNFMSMLLPAMAVKIPIYSVKYYLDLDIKFTIASIRKSKHKFSDDIISYLYELQNIQYKIASLLLKYISYWSLINSKKNTNLLISEESDLIITADSIFTYLKSSVEKAVVLLGFVYNLGDLSSHKTHKKRLKCLEEGIPEIEKKQEYYSYFNSQVSSENLEELNKYRTGILHKKGVGDLQPHSYSNKSPSQLPTAKILEILHERHSRNTALLISMYALICDELVRLDPPLFSAEQFKKEFLDTMEYLNSILNNQTKLFN